MVVRQVDHVDRRRRGRELVEMAVFVVLVGHAVVPANITVERLRGLHAVLCLLLGQAVEGEALAVGKFGHKAVRGEHFGDFVHGLPPCSVLFCRIITRWRVEVYGLFCVGAGFERGAGGFVVGEYFGGGKLFHAAVPLGARGLAEIDDFAAVVFQVPFFQRSIVVERVSCGGCGRGHSGVLSALVTSGAGA
mgnify:CR=1 FL=1